MPLRRFHYCCRCHAAMLPMLQARHLMPLTYALCCARHYATFLRLYDDTSRDMLHAIRRAAHMPLDYFDADFTPAAIA